MGISPDWTHHTKHNSPITFASRTYTYLCADRLMVLLCVCNASQPPHSCIYATCVCTSVSWGLSFRHLNQKPPLVCSTHTRMQVQQQLHQNSCDQHTIVMNSTRYKMSQRAPHMQFPDFAHLTHRPSSVFSHLEQLAGSVLDVKTVKAILFGMSMIMSWHTMGHFFILWGRLLVHSHQRFHFVAADWYLGHLWHELKVLGVARICWRARKGWIGMLCLSKFWSHMSVSVSIIFLYISCVFLWGRHVWACFIQIALFLATWDVHLNTTTYLLLY